jgi:alkylation response protein AidB-like acyl-CoA dehydrogenase
LDFTRYDLTGELGSFRQEVLSLLESVITEHVRTSLSQRKDYFDRDFNRALGEKGWIIPDLERSKGGAGLDADRRRILQAELQNADAPLEAIETTRFVYPAIEAFGQEPVRSDVLAELSSGRATAALGYSEPDGGSDIAAARTMAVRDGDQWVINGSKMWTTSAQHAEYVFLLACTDREGPRRGNLTVFLVPTDSAGFAFGPIDTLSHRTNVTYYTDVRLPDVYRVGEPGRGWDVLQIPLRLEHGRGGKSGVRSEYDQGITHLRRAGRAFAAARDWALEPRRGGRPADDPLVRHRLAEAALSIEAAASLYGTRGRIAGSEAFVAVMTDLVDLLGYETIANSGLDRIREVGEGYRAAQVSLTPGGSVEVFRNLVAREIGLPEPAYAIRSRGDA